jgi:hypothetical protein
MVRVSLALLLVLTAFAGFADAVQARPEILPVVDLHAFRGQEIAVDVRDAFGVPITRGFLQEDIERCLTRGGLIVHGRAPLKLNVAMHYLTAEFRTGRWESCGRLSGQLTRDGHAVTQKFTSSYCTNLTPNPWRSAGTQRTRMSEEEVRSRTYFGVLRTFLADLEKAVE